MEKLLLVATATILAGSAMPSNAAPLFVPRPGQSQASLIENVKNYHYHHYHHRPYYHGFYRPRYYRPYYYQQEYYPRRHYYRKYYRPRYNYPPPGYNPNRLKLKDDPYRDY